jgi:hypothetical protein
MKVIYLFLLIPFLSFIDLPLNEAKILISQKKYQEAIQVLSSDNSVEANYYRGFCYFHLGNCMSSTQALNSFIQSENKYQSESWKNEARYLITKCQNKSNNTASSIAINEPKKTSKIEQLKTDYQKSFIEINNALNQQNRYEDSIKHVEINGLNDESKNLKSFIIKANDNSLAESKSNEKILKDTKPSEKIITPAADPKQEAAHATTKEKGENDPMTEHLTNKDKGENDPMTEHLTNKEKGENDPMVEHVTKKDKGENDPMTEHLTNKDKGENDPMAEHLTNKDKGENDPMTEHLTNKEKGENDPMTEHLTNKDKGENDPMTEHLTNKTDNPESFDITSAATHHHYKILFTIDNQPEKAFLSLASIGPVTYEKVNGNNYMYYIGFYPSEDQANAARDKVKAAGYKMARVMEFNKGLLEKEHITDIEQPSVTDVLDKKINKEPVPSQPGQEVPKVTPAPEVPKKEIAEKVKIQEIIKSDVISYHILFRVLDNPNEKFDDLKQFGPLYRETFDAKGSSRYLIGNTDDINIAKQLLDKVKKAGYPASFISEYINGSLSKIIQE